LKTDPMGCHAQPRGLTNAADMQAKNLAAIGFKLGAGIVSSPDQSATQAKDRRIAMRDDAERGAGITAD
jgi:hypothetical protein